MWRQRGIFEGGNPQLPHRAKQPQRAPLPPHRGKSPPQDLSPRKTEIFIPFGGVGQTVCHRHRKVGKNGGGRSPFRGNTAPRKGGLRLRTELFIHHLAALASLTDCRTSRHLRATACRSLRHIFRADHRNGNGQSHKNPTPTLAGGNRSGTLFGRPRGDCGFIGNRLHRDRSRYHQKTGFATENLHTNLNLRDQKPQDACPENQKGRTPKTTTRAPRSEILSRQDSPP